MNRRAAIKSGIGLIASYKLCFSSVGSAQVIGSEQLPELSPSVVGSAKAAVLNLCRKAQAQSVTEVDVGVTIEAVGTLFSYMRETGYTQALENRLKGSISTFNNGYSAPSHRSTLLNNLRSEGIDTSTDNVQRALAPTVDEYRALASQLSTIGLAGIENNTLQQLSKIALRMPAQAMSAILVNNYEPFLRAADCAHLAVVAGALGLLSPPPIDAIMAALALAWDILAAAGLC